MPELSLVINADRAVAGAKQFEAAVQRVEAAARRTNQTLPVFQDQIVKIGAQGRRATEQLDLFGEAANDAAKGARGATRPVDNLGDELQQTGNQAQKAGKQTKGFASNARLAATALTAIVGGLGVREFVRYSDSATQINNRLKLVTGSTEELTEVNKLVLAQANEARVSFESQAELYQRVARSAELLGVTALDTLQVTEAVAKAITISGVSSEAANAAVVQLGQGLAAGALRGDELRSVLEQTPRVARAIADGLGVAVGELRELGAEGELTAEKVFKALQKELPNIQKEFATLGPTVGQAFTVLDNVFIDVVGSLNAATGISEGFATAIIDVATAVDESLLPSLVEASTTLRNLAIATIAGFDKARLQAKLVATGIAEGISEVRGEEGFFDTFLEEATATRNLVESELAELPIVPQFAARAALLPGLLALQFADAANEASEDQNAILRERQDILDDLNRADETAQELINESLKERDKILETLSKNREARLAALESLLSGTGGDTTTTIKLDADELKDLEKILQNVKTPLQEFQERIAFLEKARSIAPDLISQEQFNAAVQEAVDTFEKADPAIEAYKDSVEEAKKAVEGVLTPQEIYNKTLERYKGWLDQNIISQTEFNRLQLEARDTLESSDEELKARNELIEEGLKLQQSLLTPQEQLNEEIAKLDAILRVNGISLEQYNELVLRAKDEIFGLQQTLGRFGQAVGESLGDNLRTLFLDPSKQGVEDFVDSSINALQRLAAEALQNLIFQQLFQFGSGLGGPVGSVFGALFGGGRAEGGPVSPGRAFVVGEREPELFVPQQSGTILNGEQMAALSPTINNTVVVDSKGFTEALNTPRGSKDLVTAIQVNRSAIKRALQ